MFAARFTRIMNGDGFIELPRFTGVILVVSGSISVADLPGNLNAGHGDINDWADGRLDG